MRCRRAQIVVLVTTCLLGGNASIRAQSTVSTAVTATCPALSASDDQQPSGPEISIAEVTFGGALQMPISDRDQIASSIKQRTYGQSSDELIDEALERVRAGWQDRGYFRVQVSGEAKTLTSSPTSQRIAISVHVDERVQYRLREITFKRNKAISDVTVLRGLFPIKDGDIFSREKIAMGLENLRKAYGELGYINFASVPDTMFDDEKGMISLDIDSDEGKQFRVGSINIVNLDERSRQKILKDFPIGQIYNPRLLRLFLEKYSSIFKMMPDDPRLMARQLDERAGTVAITVYACPCRVC
jgi:outer membrane protein insertion porin family